MSFTKRLSLFGLIGLTSVALHAGDLTGTWKGSFDFQGQTVPLTFNLKANGATVTGDIDGLPSGDTPIKDGKLADDKLTFYVMTEYGGTAYKVLYDGKVSGDQIAFSFATEGGEFSTTMKATRTAAAAAGVSGTWKGAFDFQGQSVPLTVTLKEENGGVTGTVEGLPSGTAQIKDGKLAEGKVSFWLMTEYQGSPIKLVYNGAVSDGEIHFQFGTEDGSWGTEFTAKRG